MNTSSLHGTLRMWTGEKQTRWEKFGPFLPKVIVKVKAAPFYDSRAV